MDRTALAAAAAEQLPDPILWIDPDWRLLYANAEARRVFGWDPDEWAQQPITDLVHPDDLAVAALSAATAAATDRGSLIELRVRAADSTYRRVEIRGRGSNSGPDGLILCVRDVGDRHRWAADAGDHERLRALLDSAPGMTFTLDRAGVILTASAAVPRELGVGRDELIGTELADQLDPNDACALAETLERAEQDPGHRWVLDVATAGERARRLRLEIVDLRDDPAVEGFAVFSSDIGDLVDAVEQLSAAARLDPLTNLANRTVLLDDIDERLRGTDAVAVMFVDLDGFKAVNDLYGHPVGDTLLRRVADRLADTARPDDLVARFGGDEFVVVCSLRPSDDAETLTQRIRDAVGDIGFDVDATRQLVSASVGQVSYEPGAISAEELLAEADAEMYRVKALRRGGSALPAQVRDRRRVAGELATAFDTGRLCAYYQPVIDLETTTVVGFETLARWEHETLGLLGTAYFLAVCEEAGLAWRLTERTVDGALRMLAATADDITVTVNLSPLQLADDTVTDVVVDAFARHGAPRRSRLVVEVTEQAVLERTTMQGRKVISVLHDLADMGVRIAIDDFGTGTASLARIDQVPAHVLKIDRSFVSGLGERESSPAVIGAVLSLAQALGLTVVAEGVEEPHQAAYLAELGCRLAQGYLYGRAQPFRAALTSAGHQLTS